MATANVKGDVLRWARESAGLQRGAVARQLDVKAEIISTWETSGAKLSLGKLRNLAKLYRRPIAAFLLPSPPEEVRLPVDFRSLPEQQRKPLSSPTLLALRRARRVQRLVSELDPTVLRAILRRRLDRISLHDDPEVAAANVREALGVRPEDQKSWLDPSEALRRWSQEVERCGFLVVQASIKVQEARGVSLGDIEPSVIVVSSKDSPQARCFSLFHELGHLLLESPGLCDPFQDDAGDELTSEISHIKKTEIFCNRLAGAVLVPYDVLDSVIDTTLDQRRWSDEDLRYAASALKVSREVIVLRLVARGAATPEFYRRKRDEWRRVDAEKMRTSARAPKPARRCLRDNGRTFVSLVLDAHERGVITRRDVGDYLSIRLTHVPEIEHLLRGASTR